MPHFAIQHMEIPTFYSTAAMEHNRNKYKYFNVQGEKRYLGNLTPETAINESRQCGLDKY